MEIKYPRIIVLGGQARAGKDEVAQILVREHGYKQLCFATAVKDYAVKYFGVSDIDLLTKDVHTRKILQGIGEMFRQVVDKDYWVKIIDGLTPWGCGHLGDYDQSKMPRVVISDGRYVNEYEWAKLNGGQVWRINRIGLNGAGNNGIINHPSEVEQLTYNGWDRMIDNIEGDNWHEHLTEEVKKALCGTA